MHKRYYWIVGVVTHWAVSLQVGVWGHDFMALNPVSHCSVENVTISANCKYSVPQASNFHHLTVAPPVCN